MVHSNGAPVKAVTVREVTTGEVVENLLDVVHARECLIGLVLAAKPNKSKAATAIGVAVFDDDLMRIVKACSAA
jgi:hypothetical protein